MQHANGEYTQGKYILLVEDDPAIGHLLVEAIQEEMTVPVLFASSGEDALDLLQTRRPTVCLLDYQLPGMNGLELAERLRRRDGGERLFIVVMSAHLPHRDWTRDHLWTVKKPFDLKMVLHLLTELLSL